MRSAAEHIELAIAELRAARADLDRQIGVLERTVNELADSPSQVPHAQAPSPTRHTRTVRDIIADHGSNGQPFSLDEIVGIANAEGNDSLPASVSSILSRMKRDGEIVSVKRGVYRLIQPEAPNELGASVATSSAVSAAGPERKETHDDSRGDLSPAPIVGRM